jgi:4-amino-4-deoxy-L-arabinose transferase-like glycosyltransferase
MSKKQKTPQKTERKEELKVEKAPAEVVKKILPVWLWLFLFLLPLGIYFWFGLQHLTEFETADEHLWISNPYTGRIQQYWTAIEQKDWAKTRINDKPGVTLALISGGFGRGKEGATEEKLIQKENKWTIYNAEKTQAVYRAYRTPIVIANGLLGIFLLLAFWRLTKKPWLALASAGLIILSPTLLGISQIINPDAFLWIFSFASVLAFALFLKAQKWWLYLIDGLFAMIFLALAILSKYVALIFFPFFMAMLLWYLLANYENLRAENGLRKKVIAVSLGFPLIIAGAIGLFALLMPAAIIKPEILQKAIFEFGGMKNMLIICGYINLALLLDAVLLKSFLLKFLGKYAQFLKVLLPKIIYFLIVALFAVTIYNWSFKDNFLQAPSFIDSVKSSPILRLSLPMQLLSQAQPVTYASTPIVLALMFFILIKSIFKKSEFDFLVFIFSTFFLVFFYAVTQQGLLLQVRYSLVAFPFAAALAGIGFYELTKKLKSYFILPLFLVLIGISFWNLENIRPYYFNYVSDLLPKNFMLGDSWGMGGFEALKFIERQGGDLKKKKIWADYYGVCQFFPGKCVMEGQVKWASDADVANLDYVISTHDGKKKNKAGLERINEVFPTDVPVWELKIGDRPDNFVRVYKNPKKQ